MNYKIPPDIRGKSKVIGGIFTVTQLLFLVGGAISGGLFGIGAYNLSKSAIFAVIIGVVFAVPWIPFAFVKKHEFGDIELFTYLKYKLMFKHSNKEYLNINENYQKKGGDVC